jgi:hypothetical protein
MDLNPVGIFENSPAIYGWVYHAQTNQVPTGTKESFCRPSRDFYQTCANHPALKGWAIFKSAQRRQARHSCSIQNQTRFQAPSGGRAQAPEYAAPTGLGNGVARVTPKISLLTELESFILFILTDLNDEASKVSNADPFSVCFMCGICRLRHRFLHGSHR